ncbi:uncharacterized protein Eint_111960 [Encephalitozoon intestinalis ATCC 50506]|uniref:Uncharacterized protein n=1 Tax=Encephalitozoon intestinalis (strain ATCC 50506) TaxID=876142 RepID=E0SA73_ENCIT|nr:uncharacterized protein Eint_111960 [Encephalitozoon intestinalis ATCC 50506]ADM12695.1 hypothetical protein Eint_111960 [Encephalitozoon intestinalis ATCC 50506]UTX46557.1 putative exosome complex exonuclease 2 [Encephalitozoon intestinalis]
MEAFGLDELALVRNGIANGLRADLRKNGEARRTNVVHTDIAQSDGSIKIRRGLSEIEVSVQFKETAETLEASGILKENFDGNEFSAESIEFSKIAIPNTISSIILDLLAPYKIGIRIEFSILSNDGNIFDLFFISLGALLENLDIPIVGNLKETEKQKISIPTSKTVALFDNGHFVMDPTRIEEEASCGLIHIFSNNEGILMGCFCEGICNFEEKTLSSIIQEIISKTYLIR